MERKLSADDFRSLFGDLAEELARRKVRGEVHVAGGAAMSLEYNSDLLSGDADAQFAPDGPMHDAIAAVADKRGISRSWLNNQASVYFSTFVERGKTIFEHPNLVVMVTPPEHLAAMKILAARATRDRDDLLLLVDYLSWTRKSELLSAVGRYFPHEKLGTRQRAMLDSLPLNDD
jgi:hypothetical protein